MPDQTKETGPKHGRYPQNDFNNGTCCGNVKTVLDVKHAVDDINPASPYIYRTTRFLRCATRWPRVLIIYLVAVIFSQI